MTTDEAIGDIKFMASICGLEYPNQEDRLWKAAEMAISALKEKKKHIYEFEIKPLTEEELHEMGGHTYYHKDFTSDSYDLMILPSYVAENPKEYGYGEHWVAYPYVKWSGQNDV